MKVGETITFKMTKKQRERHVKYLQGCIKEEKREIKRLEKLIEKFSNPKTAVSKITKVM